MAHSFLFSAARAASKYGLTAFPSPSNIGSRHAGAGVKTLDTHCMILPSTSVLDEVQRLYDDGQFLQAHEVALTAGPLNKWRGAKGRILAGRLAGHLGSYRLLGLQHWLAFREDPKDDVAGYFQAWRILHRRGPLAAWRFLRDRPLPESDDPVLRANYMGLRATVLSSFRDFEPALDLLAEAQKVAPNHAWVWIETAGVRLRMDEIDAALEASARALEIAPQSRAAVGEHAAILTQLNRDDDACAVLEQGIQRIQSGELVSQRAALAMELDDFELARRLYDQVEPLLPLADDEYRRWLAARKSDAAYYCGDLDSAREWADKAGPGFHERIAKRLADVAADREKRILPVRFVRQHHVTCAPATMTALCHFFQHPAEHLEIVERICYDGTPAHSQRSWAKREGLRAVEFTATWNVARALIDRDVPFAMTTVGSGNSHLQAVIGYDALRGTLYVRDPTERHAGEFAAEAWLEQQAASGPRCLAMIPPQLASRLDGIELPDEKLYDQLTVIEDSLAVHDRFRAVESLNVLRETASNHLVTLRGRRAIAGYDQDTLTDYQIVQQLLQQFPDEVNLQVSRLYHLRRLGRRQERLDALAELCAKSACDPIFWREYGRDLSDDGRHADDARYWLERAARRRWFDSEIFLALADLFWTLQRRDEALELYRFAACLDDTNGSLGRTYFIASRHFKQTHAVLELLRSRVRRYGARSNVPARTLAWALAEIGLEGEAQDVLDAALVARPKDGDLMLYAAEVFARGKKWHRAQELLAQAAECSHRVEWLRSSAWMARFRGDLPQNIAAWREIAELDPLATDAHMNVASLLRETEGEAAERDYLRGIAERFPNNIAILGQYLEVLRPADPAEAVAVAQRILDLHPADAWARRELALQLRRLGKPDEALAEAEVALRIEPTNPTSHNVYGVLLLQVGRTAQAREAFREAIHLAVDFDSAIANLLESYPSAADRRRELAWIRLELSRQVVFGDGILCYRRYAQEDVPPEQLLATLREAVEARPDLWHAWSALAIQLAEMKQLDEALSIARQSAERFPLIPRVWVDLAHVCRLRDDRPAEIEALQEALAISPSWGQPARNLAEAYEALRQLDDARAVLERAVARDPGDPFNRGCLADILWKLNRRDEAVSELTRACRLDTGYSWGWWTIGQWLRELDRAAEYAVLARDVTTVRPGDAYAWLNLAEALNGPEDDEEKFSAFDRAIALNPRLERAYDMKAALLADLGRFDEAIATCQPDVWAERLPLELRGRIADVTFRRGETRAGIEQMRELVAEFPRYHWGWSRLAEWCDEHDEATYIEAGEKLIEIAPDRAVSWGYHADGLQRKGHRKEAQEAFRRALSIAPDYAYAGNCLIDSQVDEGDLEGAVETYKTLLEHTRDPFVLVRGVRLKLLRNEKETEWSDLRLLAETTDSHERPFAWLGELIRDSGRAERIRPILEDLITTAGMNPLIGRTWVETFKSARHALNAIHQLPDGQKAWAEAVAAVVDRTVEENTRPVLDRLVHVERRRLQASTRAWGAVGYGYTRFGAYLDGRNWLADWGRREDVEPWMLFNMVICKWHRRDYTNLRQLGETALSLSPDHTTPLHRIWLAAYEAALGGDIQTAERCLDQVSGQNLDPVSLAALALVRTAVEFLASPPGRMDDHEAAKRLRQVAAEHRSTFRREARLRRLYHRCQLNIARRAGRRFAAAWHWLRS